MSHSHATAFYWSHAGQHFEIRDEGDWCAPPTAILGYPKPYPPAGPPPPGAGLAGCTRLRRACPTAPPAQRSARPRRWAAVPESDWPAAEAQRAVILGDFDAATEFGDRRQARPRGGRALGAMRGGPSVLHPAWEGCTRRSARGGDRSRALRCNRMPEGLKSWGARVGREELKAMGVARHGRHELQAARRCVETCVHLGFRAMSLAVRLFANMMAGQRRRLCSSARAWTRPPSVSSWTRRC